MQEQIRKNLLRELMSTGQEVPIEELAEKYKCSTRTIRNAASALVDEGIPIHYRRNHGYYLTDRNDPKLQEILSQTAYEQDNDADTRKLFEMGLLLLNDGIISLNDIAERLYISKSTANSDMDELVTWLKEKHAYVIKNVRGHQVSEDLFRRVLLLLTFIREKEYSVKTIDSFFCFRYGNNCRYLDIFKIVTRSLINNGILATDSQMIEFVNQVMIIKYVLHGLRIPKEMRIDEAHAKMPSELGSQLRKSLDLNDAQMEDVYTFFAVGIMQIQPVSIKEEAEDIAAKYINILKEKYNLTVPSARKSNIGRIIGTALIEQFISLDSHNISTDETILVSPQCYEMALELRNLMGMFHHEISSFCICLMAVSLKEIIDEATFPESRLRLILLHTTHPFITERICSELERTVDPRKTDLKVMSLFEFNALKEFNHPESVIVLDPGTNGVVKSRKLGLAYMKIDALHLEQSARSLNELLLNTADTMWCRSLAEALDISSKSITFETLTKKMLDEEVIQCEPEYIYCVDDLLVIASSKKDHLLHIIQMNHPFIYDGRNISCVLECGYEYNQRDLVFVRDSIIRKVKTDKIHTCSSIQDLESLLLDDDR